MIINIRGTNGSGKTHLIKKLIDLHEADYIYPKGDLAMIKAEAICLDKKLYIIGDYPEFAPHGGCDGIKTTAEVVNLVMKYSEKGHVIFEGVIVSTVFSSWFEVDMTLDIPWLWFSLNTPIETCFDNIQLRNGGLSINEDLVKSKVKSVLSSAKKAQEGGCWTIKGSHDEALNRIEEYMRNWKVPIGKDWRMW